MNIVFTVKNIFFHLLTAKKKRPVIFFSQCDRPSTKRVRLTSAQQSRFLGAFSPAAKRP